MKVLDWSVLDWALAWLVVVLLADLPGYLVSQHNSCNTTNVKQSYLLKLGNSSDLFESLLILPVLEGVDERVDGGGHPGQD